MRCERCGSPAEKGQIKYCKACAKDVQRKQKEEYKRKINEFKRKQKLQQQDDRYFTEEATICLNCKRASCQNCLDKMSVKKKQELLAKVKARTDNARDGRI